MVDSLPNVPGHRFAIDSDGTLLKWWQNTSPDVLNDAGAQLPVVSDMKDSTYWNFTGGQNITYYTVIVFPELRDLSGYYLQANSVNYTAQNIAVSSDTTNGLDGTWENVTTAIVDTATGTAKWRTDIQPLGVSGVKGIRIQMYRANNTNATTFWWREIHLYGSIPAGQNDNRLALWHPDIDQIVGPAHFDFGDMYLGETGLKQFRVKNLSPTLTAGGATVEVQDPSALGLGDGVRLSADGALWMQSLALGDLAPGAISPILQARVIVPPTLTPLALPHGVRFRAAAGTWT